MVVTLSRQENVAIVTIDNPPVNATSHAVRAGLLAALHQTETDDSVAAIVLQCAGRTFIAGADIREFGKPPVEPHLPDLLEALGKATKPWIAAIHGTALGGGLETALVCQYRIASADAKMGLPEVNLGLIPGAGGTVRLPRLIPAEQAVVMIATGKPIGAAKALDIGLIDAIADTDLLSAALQLAQDAAKRPRMVPIDARPVVDHDTAAFTAKAEALIHKSGQVKARIAAVNAVKNALSVDVETALKAERASFQTLRDDPQSKAMRHIFFAERANTHVDRIKGVAPLPLRQIGVIGGGTMGAGIAAACLLSGFTVTVVERDATAAQAGADRVAGILDGSLKRGIISAKKHRQMCDSFTASHSYTALAQADLVIEAVFEDLNVKKQVFAQLDAVVRADTILATNTSYLDVNTIAAATHDPERVIGLHFFSPAHIMKLLEIVVPDQTSDAVFSTAVQFAKSLRKIPVLAGVCDGFIANRIMSAYRREAEYMLEDGALPWDIDAAMTSFGLPMGLFQMQDLAGLDISWAMRKRQAATRDTNQRYVDIGDKLCEAGRMGRKSGAGYYMYKEGKSFPDPEVEALIVAESARKNIPRHPLNADQIMQRILSAMQSEGAKILSEGIAQSADDIDVVMVNAYGFPRWKGGPMFMKSNG